MADTVDYSGIKVNFNTIIEKLNAVAIDFAQKKNPAIEIENLAFKDDDSHSFIGGGQYRIVTGMKDKNAELLPKTDFLDVMKEYTSWFAGKEEASYIKENHLSPIMRSEDLSSDSLSDQVSSDVSSDVEADVNEKPVSSDTPTFESYYSKDETKLFDILFEAKEDEVENKTEDDKTTDQKVIGYSISYDISVNGVKDKTVQDAIKQKSRGFFGAMLADLRNIKIIVNGKPYNIGKWTDPAKLKELVGIRDIDINRVSDNVKNAFNHDFKNNDVSTKVWSKDSLVTQLNRQGKLSPEIKSKVSDADYSVVITTNEKDPHYPQYDQKSIAKTASKGFGTGDNLIDTNAVSEKDVIKIDDIENLYKSKSAYDATTATDVRDRASGGQKTPNSTKTSTPKATAKQTTKTASTVTEKEGDTPSFGNENTKKEDNKDENKVKEDGKIDTLIKSEEYKNYVNTTLKEQCDIEFQNDEHTCQYGSTEEITNDMMSKGVNDLDLLRKIKNDAKQSYYITVTKNLQQTLKEEIEVQNGILNLLFENIDETEDIIEEGDESKKQQAIDTAIDNINLTGDKKEDETSKKTIKTGVKNLLKKDKVEVQVKKVAERVIKNTIIKTLDKFNTGLNFDDLDTDCYSTSIIKDQVQESLYDYIEKKLVSLYESDNKTRNEGKLPDKIKSLNSDLIGKLTDIVDKGTSGWHVDPYCAISSSDRVVEYMQKHNIGDDSIYTEIKKKPYCAIVLAKRDLELEDKTIQGGSGNKTLTDTRVNQVLDTVCGPDNKLNTINCKNQNRDTMDNVKGDLISRTLAFYSEKNSKHENFVRNASERHVPELDVWVRPFDLTEDNKPTEIPSDLDIFILLIFVLPDPIREPEEKQDNKKKTADKQTTKQDWYIIPHKHLKDLGDRPHQEVHYQDGVTQTKTSDDEYKP